MDERDMDYLKRFDALPPEFTAAMCFLGYAENGTEIWCDAQEILDNERQ